MNQQHRLAYQAIKELSQKRSRAVTILTRFLGLTRASYYKWCHREVTQWELQDQRLKERVLWHFRHHFDGIGAGTLLIYIQRDELIDFPVTIKQIKRVQKSLNIRCNVRVKRFNRVKQTKVFTKENVLNRRFEVTAPYQVLCADSTELTYGTNEITKVRFSGVLDLYGRRMLAFNITATETAEAEIEVFKRVFDGAGDVHPMVHTDRGSAYTAHAFEDYIKTLDVVRSMSRPGTPWDNAPIERWWNEFKLRWMESHPRPKTLAELTTLVAEGIEYFNHESRTAGRNGQTADEMWAKAA